MLKRFFAWIFSALFVPEHWRERSPGSIETPPLDRPGGFPDPDFRGTGNPRGIRNNNPGNVEYGAAKWQGLAGSDGRFCIFKSSFWGVRCLAYNLNNYYNKYGLKTVGQMLDRWAPPFENNTNAYAAVVAREMKVGVNDRLTWNSAVKYQMVVAIIRHENGRNPLDFYDPEMIREAIKSAS